MSLPSQSARGGGRAGAVSSRQRRRGPFRIALPFLIVAVLVVIVWFTMRPAGVRPDSPMADERPGAATTLPRSSDDPGPSMNKPKPPKGTVGASGPTRELPRTERAGPVGGDAGPEATAGAEPEATVPSESAPTGGGVLSRALEGRSDRGEGTVADPGGSDGGSGGDASERVRERIATARRLASENDRVGARAMLSGVLRDPGLGDAGADLLRDELTLINEDLVFGRVAEPGDPIVEEYRVQPGDSLSKIAQNRELATHWKLIQRVNGLSDPTKVRLGQTLKLVRGPFHAVVDKSDFRMDIWHGPPSDPSRWVYIRSFDVGLGADDGTPVGSFVISENKLENPGWVNPRDGRERYTPDDPANPIGEFWLGMEGVGASADESGYGIHGTIDPASVGGNESMGCVRLRDGDIAVVYELLSERVSRVEVIP